MLTLSDSFSIPSSVLYREIEGEAVLLDTESGQYFGLDALGNRIFRSLQGSSSLEPLYQGLLEEYEVSPDRLKSDLLSFVESLEARGLIARAEVGVDAKGEERAK